MLLIAAVLLLLPFPGSLSVQMTRAAATAFAGSSGVELLSELPLALLAVAAAAVVGHAWWVRSPRRGAAAAGVVGIGIAYAASEGLKLAAGQPRPCVVWNLAGDCPPAGDWSFPSNHATLAFGAVVVIAVVTRSAIAASGSVVLAIIVAAGRVMEGSHYVHDVAAGAALGTVAVGAVVLGVAALRRPAKPGAPQ